MNLTLKQFEDSKVVLDLIPIPLYVTSLSELSPFHYVNPAFATLLGYSQQELIDDYSPVGLYANPNQRSVWLSKFVGITNGNIVRDEASFRRKVGPPIEVLDLSRAMPINNQSDDKFIVGVVLDMSDARSEKALISAYEAILNLDWIDVGLHQVDSCGRIFWMNEAEQKWLGVTPDWIDGRPPVHLLTALDAKDGNRIDDRIQKKLKGEGLTDQEHRAFMLPPTLPIGNRQGAESIPVNIQDHLTRDLQGKPLGERILTVVRNERIDPSIRNDLIRFGPKNPLLSRLKIKSFIKVKRKFADEFVSEDLLPQVDGDNLVFVWGNEAFRQELQAQGRLGTPSRLEGKTEIDLYPEPTIGPLFLKADKRVLALKDGDSDESIESHPVSHRGAAKLEKTLVQVLKTPIFSKRDPEHPAGVIGFYWDTKVVMQAASVVEQLRSLFQWQNVLEQVPLPVWVKDEALTFTYANAAYCEANGFDLFQVIGARDSDLFEQKYHEIYERDDRSVIAGKSIVRTEAHPVAGKPDEPAKLVRVWKKQVSLVNGLTGVQGIYCDVDGAPPVDRTARVDYQWRQLHIDNRKIDFPISDFPHEAMSLLDALLKTPNEVVEYEQLLKWANRTDLLTDWKKQHFSTVKNSIHKWKQKVSQFLKEKHQTGELPAKWEVKNTDDPAASAEAKQIVGDAKDKHGYWLSIPSER